VFRCLGWASIHCLERVAGATAAAVVVLVSTNGTVAGMDEGGGPSSPTVLDAFTESLNSGSVVRSQALLADDAVIVDHDGQHAGARLRVWLARAVVEGIHVSVLARCRLDGRDVSAVDQAKGSTGWRTMFSWRPIINGAPLSRDGPIKLDTGWQLPNVDGVIVVDGGTIRFLGLGITERSDCTALAPGRLAVNPPPATATTVAVVVPASCFSGALLGLLLRRVRKRGRTTVQPPRNLLQHLHEATIQRRLAVVSAAGQGGSDPGSAAHLHAAKSARP
jgi:hemin uptake protein HemP